MLRFTHTPPNTQLAPKAKHSNDEIRLEAQSSPAPSISTAPFMPAAVAGGMRQVQASTYPIPRPHADRYIPAYAHDERT